MSLLTRRYIRQFLSVPKPTQQKRTCKIMQDCARILHARLAWHVHVICPFSCTILAQSCTYLARNGARFCKRCCKNNYLQVCTFFCKILQELVQDCARIVQEKGHIACTCQASLACKILAQSCMILQVRFCWEGSYTNHSLFFRCYYHCDHTPIPSLIKSGLTRFRL